MTLSALLPLLSQTERFGELIESLRRPAASLSLVAPEPPTAYTVASLWREFGAPVIVLAPGPDIARRIADQLFTWCGDDAPVFQFVENETLPFERLSPDRGATHQRLRALAALESDGGGRPPIVVVSVLAAAQLTLTPAAFRAGAHTLRVGDTARPGELLDRWVAMGYVVEPTVEVPGTASRRGGILDVYPVSATDPVRIEFFGDEIESIRVFDPETQRSVEPAQSVTVVPAEETLPLLADAETVQGMLASLDFSRASDQVEERVIEELGRAVRGEMRDDLAFYAGFFNHGSLFDYVPPSALLVTLRPNAVKDAAVSADRRLARLRAAKERRGEIPGKFPQPHMDRGVLADAIRGCRRSATLSPFGVDDEGDGEAERLPFELAPVSGGRVERALAEVARRAGLGHRVVVLTQHAGRLAEMAAERDLEA
ncbi:MAG: hypothetical protein V3S18_06770, partial [Dehalococcoidia bacterium]